MEEKLLLDEVPTHASAFHQFLSVPEHILGIDFFHQFPYAFPAKFLHFRFVHFDG